MAPPGRLTAAAGSALRVLVVNVLGVALVGGVAGAVVATVPEGSLVIAPFGFFVGIWFGAVGGAAAGAVHAAAQVALMLAVPAHRRRPASPLVATAVSFAIGVGTVVAVATEPGTEPAVVAGWAAAAVAYVAGTWPVANAVVPPGRPRRRSG